MDSLAEILGKKSFDTPDEMQVLRDYVSRHYKSQSFVKFQRGALILSVPSSALAATLQLEKEKIANSCHLTKKLVIRTGRA